MYAAGKAVVLCTKCGFVFGLYRMSTRGSMRFESRVRGNGTGVLISALGFAS